MRVLSPDMRYAAVFDLDGTIADCSHRRHFLEGPGKKDWKSFFAGIPDDKPNVPVVNTFHALQGIGLTGIICSGRGEEYRDVTVAWLDLWQVNYDALYMRPAKDNRDDTVIKAELLVKMQAEGYEPHIVCDDRDRVVAMWRGLGYTCLQAAPGAF